MASLLDPRETARALSRVPLFTQLPGEALERLAALVELVQVGPGDTVFHQHERGDSLYAVHSGQIRIWVRDEDSREVTLSELTEGQFFGELAVLDTGERSANATATAESRLYRLGREEFHQFLLEHPACAVEVIRELGARMRQTNLLISQRVARNVNVAADEQLTMGQRLADKLAAFGGSWTFIFLFGGILFGWMALNTFILARLSSAGPSAQWDPYPYILLNLVLSSLAALQAPVIMMSQNRAAERDRLTAEQDYQVNLKSELMLEELMRREREQALHLEHLTRLVHSLAERR
jgi:uncharacterized membrane protein